MLVDVTVDVGAARLVGRDAQLAWLDGALARFREGSLVAAVVAGEAGVGKTRLVEEFTGAGRLGSATVLTGNCLDLGEQGMPFAPFAQILRAVVRIHGPEVFAGHREAFAGFLPELGVAAPSGQPGVAVGRAMDQPRGYLFGLISELLERLASQDPVVLLVEDLHWSDRSTRDLIDFLVRGSRPAGVLLLLTFRSDELHRGHPLRPFLGEFERLRGVERLDVPRLDWAGTAQLIADLAGDQPGVAVVDEVFERGQGNPFFTQELVACGAAPSCDMPDTLRDLLLSRVDRLPEVVRRVLRIAAAGGFRTSHQLIGEVFDGDVAQLEEALRAAVAAHLLVVGSDGALEFRHALVREAIHDDLLPGERIRLHTRFAEVIAARPALLSQGQAPADLARHWLQARNLPRALVAKYAAAVDAGARYAYAEQTQLLNKVLELWEVVADAPQLLGIDHLRVLEDAVEASAAAAEYALALKLSRAFLAEADSAAQPLRVAAVLRRRGHLLRTLGQGDGFDDLERALELLVGLDDPARLPLLAELGVQLTKYGRRGTHPIIGKVLKEARESNDEVVVNIADLAGYRARRMDQQAAGEVEQLRRVCEVARRVGDQRTLVLGMVCLSDLLFEVGDYAGSQLVAARGRVDATQFGITRSTGVYLVSNEAEALIALGRWDEAEVLCVHTQRLDPPGIHAMHWMMLMSRVWLAREHPEARALVGRTLGYLSRPYLAHQSSLPLHELRILVALEDGDRVGVLEAVDQALRVPGLSHHPRYAWPVLLAAARGLVRFGDPAPVVGLAGDLVCRYPAEWACAAQLRAQVAGPGDDVVGLWRGAVAAWRVDGQPHQLGWALLGLAEVLAGSGQRVECAAVVGEVLGLADRLGAVGLRRQGRLLADRVGLDLGVPVGVPAAGGVDPLTGRERQVLGLLVLGHSNRRIAEDLFISAKTVSVHVSRIMAKLGVSSRGEAAAVARRLGLTDRG